MPITPPTCPYCHATAILADASAVYGPKFEGAFNLWICLNYPDCDSYVGVHKDQIEPKPLGTMANAELRKLRKRVHAMFDPLWKPGPCQEFKGRLARKDAYRWISEKMGRDFHTAEANEEECRRALVFLIERGQRENTEV